MMQIHGLRNTVLEDQVITSQIYSYMVPKHLKFDVTKASHWKPLSLCSLWRRNIGQRGIRPIQILQV